MTDSTTSQENPRIFPATQWTLGGGDGRDAIAGVGGGAGALVWHLLVSALCLRAASRAGPNKDGAGQPPTRRLNDHRNYNP